MKALIVGCNGLLGQNLLRALPPGWTAAGAARAPEPSLPGRLAEYHVLDAAHRGEVESVVGKAAPDFILNAAALTDVDRCEREPALAEENNLKPVGYLAASGKPLLQVSTDYVFDGEAGPYAESAPARPLSRYGSVKLASEGVALAGAPGSLVVRTMTVWGLGKGAKGSFVDFVRQSLEAGKPIRVVTDQRGNPTLAEDLAIAIWKLIEGGHGGLYHAAGSEWNSRFEWARAIAEFYALDPSLIQPCLTSDLKQAAARPLRSGLLTDKLYADTAFRLRDVRGQLLRFAEASLQSK